MRKSVVLWAWTCTAGILVACGGSSSQPPPPECTPATCEAAGKNCGALPDGCGGTLQCGSCPAGQTCAGGGVANVCGAGGACTPTTCAAAGATCGQISNGCAGTLQCGTCPSGQTCGGGGAPNVCGACTPVTCAQLGTNCGEVQDHCGGTLQCGTCPAGETCGANGRANVCGIGPCTPSTCAQLGANCGAAGDGCGGTLRCGSCPAGQTCGASTPNVCGTPQTPGGTTAWVHIFPGAPVSVVGTDGLAFAAVALSGESAPSVAKVDAGGNVLWTQPDPTVYTSATLSAANGSAYFAGFTPSSPPSGFLARYSSSGASRTTVDIGNDFTSFESLASNAVGDVAWIKQDQFPPRIGIIRANGAQLAIAQSATLPVFFTAVALDDSGNAVAAGQVIRSFTVRGQAIAAGPALLKFDAGGILLWVRSLAGASGDFSSMGTTHLGTVVAAGELSGNLTWGAQTFARPSPTSVIFVAESGGQPRFFRELPAATGSFHWSLGVDPAGQMVVAATLENCAGVAVRRYNLAGDFLWARAFSSSSCDMFSAGVGMLGSNAVLGGSFSGTVDFGKGPVQPSTGTRDGFLIELQP